MPIKLITAQGYEFWSEGFVTIENFDIDTENLSSTQKHALSEHLQLRAIQTIYTSKHQVTPKFTYNITEAFQEYFK